MLHYVCYHVFFVSKVSSDTLDEGKKKRGLFNKAGIMQGKFGAAAKMKGLR